MMRNFVKTRHLMIFIDFAGFLLNGTLTSRCIVCLQTTSAYLEACGRLRQTSYIQPHEWPAGAVSVLLKLRGKY